MYFVQLDFKGTILFRLMNPLGKRALSFWSGEILKPVPVSLQGLRQLQRPSSRTAAIYLSTTFSVTVKKKKGVAGRPAEPRGCKLLREKKNIPDSFRSAARELYSRQDSLRRLAGGKNDGAGRRQHYAVVRLRAPSGFLYI